MAARHLANAGAVPEICLVAGRSMSEEACVNLNIARKMDLPVAEMSEESGLEVLAAGLERAEVVIDALLGTGLKDVLREPFCSIISAVNSCGKPVVSVDIPSGLDADSGKPLGICIKACVTVTLGLPKKAFSFDPSRAYTGDLVVDRISIPGELLT